ncbi:MAG: hypothetical protein JW822_09285 [Spirochaetales bacterium]|nr:hypothetical protein [Spirochaetales bacterium]
MKKIICLILAAGFITGCVGSSYKDSIIPRVNSTRLEYADRFVAFPEQKERDVELEERFDELLLKYAGSASRIINYMKEMADTYCQSPFIKHYHFISDRTRKLKGDKLLEWWMLLDVTTAVHETTHLFSDWAACMSPEYSTSRPGILSYYAPTELMAVYLEDWGVHYILMTETVPSANITPFIKDKRLLKQSRYETYVDPSSTYQSTQRDGVYGLMNEYHAYYYSLVVEFNKVKDLGIQMSVRKSETSRTIYSFYTDNYLAFLQFSAYLLTYFRMVEKEYPDIYSELLRNNTLLEAFLRIHDAFKALQYELIEVIKSKSEDGSFHYRKEYEMTMAEYLLPANQSMLAGIREKVKGF